jgi:enoyl-CoA hydratase/carnithine racemase
LAAVEQYFDSGLSVITLNNSQNGNILAPVSLGMLNKGLRNSIAHPNVRAILLRSNGPHFCSGMDMRFLQFVKNNKRVARKTLSQYVLLLKAIYNSPIPVIAAINGDVKAGGIGLICVCDIVLATANSHFELSEVLWGLIPANVFPFLMSLRLSPQQARYLALTAQRLTAKQALQYSLIDDVFDENELEKGLKAILKNLFRASPIALAEIKDFTASAMNLLDDRVIKSSQKKLMELISKPEVIKAIEGFNHGQVPHWFSRCSPERPLLIKAVEE